MDRAFTQELLTRTKATLRLYMDAYDALAINGVQEYRLDTGQDQQRVTKLNLEALSETIDILMNRCATLEARLNGGSLQVRQGF